MYFEYNNKKYEIKIIKKKNKNTYIRYNNKTIIVTTNYLVSEKKIKKLIELNRKLIISWINKDKEDDSFYLWGKKYQIIFDNNTKNVVIDGDKVYSKNSGELEKYLKEYTKEIFNIELNKIKEIFEEKIPNFSLKIRKMKTRWGVCNKKSMSITLNSNLIKYDIVCLDYVIIHELSHFIYFDHSKDFWNEVKKYCPNYKEIKKMLLERK